jgi:argininosuccinate lyase
VPNELTLLTANLPSGYHRDLQLTKEILFPAIESLKQCLGMMVYALPQMQVETDILRDEKYRYLFSVEAVNRLVQEGKSFREAYRIVGNQIETGTFSSENIRDVRHTHEGSIGNLCNDAIRDEMKRVLEKMAFFQ